MLIMVMEKPMQFTIVSADPFDSEGAFCATSVENNGESAITTSPQIHRKMSNDISDAASRNKGETIQQIAEESNAKIAPFFAHT